MDPSEVVHRSGAAVVGQLPDPLTSRARAGRVAADDLEGLMDVSGDKFVGYSARCMPCSSHCLRAVNEDFLLVHVDY